MAVAFTRVSLWLWGAGGGKDHHREAPSAAGSPMNASSDFGFRDLENNIKHPQTKGAKMRSARPRRKWQSREERWRKVDREFDVVLVPSDGGGCLSGSDSDDSDWSIGWLEPHAPDFFNDGGGYESEVETSFAVLVPCYGRGRCERAGEGPSYNNRVLTAVDLTGGFLSGESSSPSPLAIRPGRFRDARISCFSGPLHSSFFLAAAASPPSLPLPLIQMIR